MLPGISLEQGRGQARGTARGRRRAATRGHWQGRRPCCVPRDSPGRAARLASWRYSIVPLAHTASAQHSRAIAPRGKERGQGAAGTPTRVRAYTHTHACRAQHYRALVMLRHFCSCSGTLF